jgi:hypothetical protein
VSEALAGSLAAKVGGLPPGGLSPERVLETIAAAKASSRYGSGERWSESEEARDPRAI